MKLNAGIQYIESGMTTSVRAMQVQSQLMGIGNDNIMGFDKVGYQRKEPVVSSFTEYLGVDGISSAVDDKVGRLGQTSNPLDLAISKKGYFQTQSKEGIKLTRDGRFKLDKNGYLLSLDDSKVLSSSGTPIKFSRIPTSLKDIKIDSNGKISAFNNDTKKLDSVGYIGVVNSNGVAVINPEIRQGFNEYSNVNLENEFMALVPIRRAFDANRQIYMIESQNLTKAISELGNVSS